MADTKITALAAITTVDPAADVLPIVDVSDTSMAASGTTKKITSNQILGAGGTATLASATITGDLSVGGNGAFTGTGYLALQRALNPVGENGVTSLDFRWYSTGTTYTTGARVHSSSDAAWTASSTPARLMFSTVPSGSTSLSERYRIDNTGIHTWSNVGGVAGTAMTLNSTGLGLGVSPVTALSFPIGTNKVVGQSATSSHAAGNVGSLKFGIADGGGDYSGIQIFNTHNGTYSSQDIRFFTGEGGVSVCTERMRITPSGNVGIGVTPSASWTGGAVIQQQNGAVYANSSLGSYDLSYNSIRTASNSYVYAASSLAAARFQLRDGAFNFFTAPSGTAGTAITFTQAMTLDASGNLLVGITSGSYNRIKKDSVADAGNAIFELVGASNATSSIHYSVSSYNANAANAASKFGRDGVTLRSINAGGTVNASGADYAEYMTKAGGFVLSKGDVAGIDANGKLTNVFADAVSFVVKSTDPSYVGNDKWGNDLEGDELEAARQLVDRIAFAGQVPVNVTGAKAGDYIVPVVDGTGIKGIAVSNPTFEQYQLAVGKVIAIDADGRARIIVKVA